MKKLLLFGGSQFIGRHLLEELLTAEHRNRFDITLFNRQRTNTHLFPELHKIKGDRETDNIRRIAAEHWDYVIDLSSYYPNSLASLFRHLDKRLKRYVYISTVSVYDMQTDTSGLREEDGLLLNCSKAERTDTSPKTYGKRKAACEAMIRSAGIPHIILRPGVVYGNYDYTDRFYYWLYQVRKNDTLLMPEAGRRTLSLTYVGDLVECIIRSLEFEGEATVFNAISQPEISIGEIVETAADIMGRSPQIADAPADFLHENEVKRWADLPLWLDMDHYTYGNRRMKEILKVRPTDFRDNVSRMIDYFEASGWHEPTAGMPEETRRQLLEKLQSA